jgi:hypothetical protein
MLNVPLKLLIVGANGLVWVFILACFFKLQWWMAFGPVVSSVIAVKAFAP